MADTHYYDFQKILDMLDIEASDADPVGLEIIELAHESENEINTMLKPYMTVPISVPLSANDGIIGHATNIRTRGKWIEKTDHERGKYFIDQSDKMVNLYIEASQKAQDTDKVPEFFLVTTGNADKTS